MSDDGFQDKELGFAGLAGLDELLADGVVSLEGKLAADFDWDRLRSVFSNAPDALASLGRPSLGAKELSCLFPVSGAELRQAFSLYPVPFGLVV